jgi:hypothetical protein
MPPLLGRLHEPPEHARDGLGEQILCDARESIKIRDYRVYAEQPDGQFFERVRCTRHCSEADGLLGSPLRSDHSSNG